MTSALFSSSHLRDNLLEGVISWLNANVKFFDPPQEDDVEESDTQYQLIEQPRKSFIELGAALRLTTRVPHLYQREDIKRLARSWVEMAHKRNVLFDIRRRIGFYVYKAAAYSILRALDSGSDVARESLQNVLDRNFIGHIEMTAWTKADLKYYVEAAGLRHTFTDDEILISESTLRSPPPLTYARNIDLYGITHLLFDLSDFGAKNPSAVMGSLCKGTREYIKLAMAMCVTERDWDLTAELLMNRIALGDIDDPLNREATTAICEAQQPSGFIPDIKWLSMDQYPGDPNERAKREFDLVYHCTTVCFFLLACEAAIK